jgi:hypothetical protein
VLAAQGVVEIRAKGKTKIKRLVDAWSKQKGINPQSVRLLGPEGQRLNLESSLNEANINDGVRLSRDCQPFVSLYFHLLKLNTLSTPRLHLVWLQQDQIDVMLLQTGGTGAVRE